MLTAQQGSKAKRQTYLVRSRRRKQRFDGESSAGGCQPSRRSDRNLSPIHRSISTYCWICLWPCRSTASSSREHSLRSRRHTAHMLIRWRLEITPSSGHWRLSCSCGLRYLRLVTERRGLVGLPVRVRRGFGWSALCRSARSPWHCRLYRRSTAATQFTRLLVRF